MVLFGCKEEGQKSCLARKTFWEMETAVTSGCSGIELKLWLAHGGLNKISLPPPLKPLNFPTFNPSNDSKRSTLNFYLPPLLVLLFNLAGHFPFLS